MLRRGFHNVLVGDGGAGRRGRETGCKAVVIVVKIESRTV